MWTDPSGLSAASQDAQQRKASTKIRGGAAQIGRTLACKFDAIASAINAAMDPSVETITEVAMDVATGRCKAVTKPKRAKKRHLCDAPSRGLPFSFPAGVLVCTEDGFVAVEDVAVGDRVYAWDAEAGERVLSEVSDTFGRMSTDMVEIGYRNDRGELGSLRVTPEHPFATLDRTLDDRGGWVEAGRLVPGQVIFDVDGGEGATVVSLRSRKAREPVYNFGVASTHSYYVTDDGLLTHNRSRSGGGGGRGRSGGGCDDDGDKCDQQYAEDRLWCLSMGPKKKRSCWASAGDRYGACIAGTYIPSLYVRDI